MTPQPIIPGHRRKKASKALDLVRRVQVMARLVVKLRQVFRAERLPA